MDKIKGVKRTGQTWSDSNDFAVLLSFLFHLTQKKKAISPGSNRGSTVIPCNQAKALTAGENSHSGALRGRKKIVGLINSVAILRKSNFVRGIKQRHRGEQ